MHSASFSQPLKFFLYIVLLMPVVFWHSGCGFGKPGSECVAVVNKEKIYLDEFENRFQSKLTLMRKSGSYDDKQIQKLRREFLDEMIDEKVMLHRAKELGIQVKNDELIKKIDEIKTDYSGKGFSGLFKGKGEFQTWQEELRKRLILEKLIGREISAGISVSDDEARAYFESQPAGSFEDSIHVSQIVLPDRDKAEDILKRLKNGEDFAALAREASTGPEGAKGGDLGRFTKGVLPEQFDRALFSLVPGKYSGIVETPYGYHIFKVLEKTRKKTAEFEDVKSQIKEKLKREKEEKSYESWLTRLRAAASITINQDVLIKAGQGADSLKQTPGNLRTQREKN